MQIKEMNHELRSKDFFIDRRRNDGMIIVSYIPCHSKDTIRAGKFPQTKSLLREIVTSI